MSNVSFFVFYIAFLLLPVDISFEGMNADIKTTGGTGGGDSSVVRAPNS